MTTPEKEPEDIEIVLGDSANNPEERDERRRRMLLLMLLLLLVVLCCCVGYLFVDYLRKPRPLPEMVLPPQAQVCRPPVYKLSISNVDGPVGVAVSPDDQRLYVAESTGQRLIKIFDRDGRLIGSFAPPGTTPGMREPKFLAVDATGRVFLADRSSNAIFIFDENGAFLDAIIAQDMTLTKFLRENLPGGLPAQLTIAQYDGINGIISYQVAGGAVQKISVPKTTRPWAPLGVRFDQDGNLIYTDITAGAHSVNIIPAEALSAPLSEFAPQILSFGNYGSGNGQFDFPQAAVRSSNGSFFVSDGNNNRIAAWNADRQYKTFFGFGAAESALNLPRGLWINARDCLAVADAVGSVVRVYDVRNEEPVFAYTIGTFGIAEGEFNYPVDLIIDGTGRLYIADRENNRVQIWSY